MPNDTLNCPSSFQKQTQTESFEDLSGLNAENLDKKSQELTHKFAQDLRVHDLFYQRFQLFDLSQEAWKLNNLPRTKFIIDEYQQKARGLEVIQLRIQDLIGENNHITCQLAILRRALKNKARAIEFQDSQIATTVSSPPPYKAQQQVSSKKQSKWLEKQAQLKNQIDSTKKTRDTLTEKILTLNDELKVGIKEYTQAIKRINKQLKKLQKAPSNRAGLANKIQNLEERLKAKQVWKSRLETRIHSNQESLKAQSKTITQLENELQVVEGQLYQMDLFSAPHGSELQGDAGNSIKSTELQKKAVKLNKKITSLEKENSQLRKSFSQETLRLEMASKAFYKVHTDFQAIGKTPKALALVKQYAQYVEQWNRQLLSINKHFDELPESNKDYLTDLILKILQTRQHEDKTYFILFTLFENSGVLKSNMMWSLQAKRFSQTKEVTETEKPSSSFTRSTASAFFKTRKESRISKMPTRCAHGPN